MSKIEWTNETWNPVKGCSLISPGCGLCYAKSQFPRFRGRHGYGDTFEDVRFVKRLLQKPLKRTKPTMYFVNSMSDLFHEDLEVGDIEKILSVMERCPQHLFQVLTKRPERMVKVINGRYGVQGRNVPTNVWLGVSVENRKHGVSRISILRKVPTPNRFLSVEPLLGSLGKIDLSGIGWVIVGGESGGKRARQMRAEWVREVRDQCIEANVPFFLKQWGMFDESGRRGKRVNHSHVIDGREWLEYPSGMKPYARKVTQRAGHVRKSVAHEANEDCNLKASDFRTHEEVDAAVLRGAVSKRRGAAFKAWLTMRAQPTTPRRRRAPTAVTAVRILNDDVVARVVREAEAADMPPNRWLSRVLDWISDSPIR